MSEKRARQEAGRREGEMKDAWVTVRRVAHVMHPRWMYSSLTHNGIPNGKNINTNGQNINTPSINLRIFVHVFVSACVCLLCMYTSMPQHMYGGTHLATTSAIHTPEYTHAHHAPHITQPHRRRTPRNRAHTHARPSQPR